MKFFLFPLHGPGGIRAVLVRLLLVIISVCAGFTAAFPANLFIENTEFNYVPGTGQAPVLVCTVSWEAAWHTARNHDAVWLFVKLRQQHRSESSVLVAASGHETLAAYGNSPRSALFQVPSDRRGVFVAPPKPHRGVVSWKIKLRLDETSLRNYNFNDVTFGSVYGVEMVYVPEGPFYEGDADTTAHREAAAYEAVTKQPLLIASENEIGVGTQPGNLYYRVDQTPEYRGDQRGPIPAEYPKGFRAFYVMKYELTQGQYADFLNSIYEQYTNVRANFGGRLYRQLRGTIGLENGRYLAQKPREPLNFVSWDDGCAFADWACLRPMTELEYVKASRGPQRPAPGDYPWGTSLKAKLNRFFNDSGELVVGAGLAESQLTDETKELFGGSYFWVMDLATGYWERVVGYGHEQGRNFKGTHGDGRLSAGGEATNDDWPRNHTGGVGYKGGGYYQPNMRAGAFVPNSPVGYRPFAAWAEGPRAEGYGFRCVRTASVG